MVAHLPLYDYVNVIGGWQYISRLRGRLDALDVLFAQLTRDLFAIAKFLLVVASVKVLLRSHGFS